MFGAAAAAGTLLELTPLQVRYMLSYTGHQTAGLYTMFRDPEHIEKAYAMGGMPAHNGLQAAMMVAAGWTGVEDIFSGERDFFHTFAPEEFDREDLSRDLGKTYEMLRASIKRWPIGGPIQGPMHVLNDLMAEHGFGANDVEKVVANMPDKELEIVNNRPMPDISVQHLLAVMSAGPQADVQVGLPISTAWEGPGSPEDARACMRVGDPALTDVQRRWRCVMEVHLKDGRVLQMARPWRLGGSFENPLTPREENEKAMDLLAPVLGGKTRLALLDTLAEYREGEGCAQAASAVHEVGIGAGEGTLRGACVSGTGRAAVQASSASVRAPRQVLGVGLRKVAQHAVAQAMERVGRCGCADAAGLPRPAGGCGRVKGGGCMPPTISSPAGIPASSTSWVTRIIVILPAARCAAARSACAIGSGIEARRRVR